MYIDITLARFEHRMFEMKFVMPSDTILTITVMDKDWASTDDIIGQTEIDLENRFYTQYRARCGLPQLYITYAYPLSTSI